MKTYDMSEQVAERLRAFRKVRRISSESMARGIAHNGYEMTRTALSALEHGRSKIVPIDLVMAAMEFLRISFTELLEGPLCGTCYDKPMPGFVCRTCARTVDGGGQLVNGRGLL